MINACIVYGGVGHGLPPLDGAAYGKDGRLLYYI